MDVTSEPAAAGPAQDAGVADPTHGRPKLVVTSRGFRERPAWNALKRALPESWLEGSGFRGVLLVEAEGDPLALAACVALECGEAIGRITAIFAEVHTEAGAIRQAAAEVAGAQVREGESFCFRLRRRGWSQPDTDASMLEREIGGAVFDALERGHGAPPIVDLQDPDVTVVAEVLGRRTLLGQAK